MEKIFCETKKIIAMLLLVLMISIFVVPISKAAYTDSMIEGKGYEYVEEIDGDILKIGKQNYIKLNALNSASKFKLISHVEDELVSQTKPKPAPVPEEPKLEIIRVSGIELNKKQGNLYEELGGKYKLKATISPANATNKNIKWTSDNTKVLAVDQNGEITWKSIGIATITATTEDGGFKATCKVRVTRLEINKKELTLNIGEQSKLEINYAGSGKKKDITWTSSNEKIAKVDSDGMVTGIGEGEAIVTGKAQHADIKLECKVTVKKVNVNKIKLNKTSATLSKGDTLTLKATIEPTNATNKNVIWTSDNANVATVSSSGEVTAKGTGKTKIRAKADGKEAICEITVNQKVTSITLNKTNVNLPIGGTVTLTATIKPTNAANKNVTWESTNTNVATVSSSGKVTAKGLGTTEIKVTAKDGSGKKAVCKVTVKLNLSVIQANNTEYYIVKNASNFAEDAKNKGFYQGANENKWGDSCLGFSFVYANAIYKNNFDITKNQPGLNYGNDANVTVGFSQLCKDNQKAFLQTVYDEIVNNKPCVIQVNGNTSGTSRHYVVAIGVKTSTSRANIKETDLLILDVWDASIEPLKGKGSGSRFMITGYDTGRSYGYQAYIIE